MNEPAEKAERYRRQEERRAFWKSARRQTRHLSVTVDGVTLIVPTDDAGTARTLFVRGVRRQRARLEAAARILAAAGTPPAGTLVDVGAGLGTTTVFARVDGPWERVLALEPYEPAYRVLRANIVLNGLESGVRTLPVAVGRPGSSTTLLLDPRDAGLHRLARHPEDEDVPPPADPPPAEVEVKATTLDELQERGVIDLDDVGTVWVDAPGSEADVLAGASRLCAAGVPFVLTVSPGELGYRGRARLSDALVGMYSHFVDLDSGGDAPQPLPALPELYRRYEGDRVSATIVVYRGREWR